MKFQRFRGFYFFGIFHFSRFEFSLVSSEPPYIPGPTGDSTGGSGGSTVQKENPFTDVAPTSKFYKAILWATENVITKGTTTTTFSPSDTLTRAHAITFFARMSGIKDEAVLDYSHSFTDVKSGRYYYNAVSWAEKNGIAEGIIELLFGPDNASPRSEVVSFLYKYFVK